MDATPIGQIAQWCGGVLTSPASVNVVNICTDSRAVAKGDLFVALRGEKFDAHAFVAEAALRCAGGAILSQEIEQLPPGFGVIRVSDTLEALQKIAAAYRRTLALKVIAITGSNGKTSTKDFAAAVLSERFTVTKTEGNLNNHIGLPLTILSATARDNFGVFEIGMNHPGEIAPLARLAAPDVAIITNVGTAHIEFMKTAEAIALEKGALAESVPPDGHVILNANDKYTASIAVRSKAPVTLAGIERGDVQATNIRPTETGSEFTITAGMESTTARLSTPGLHMVGNALLAVAAGWRCGLDLEQCAAGLKAARLTRGRLERKHARGVTMLDDTYNANPESMIAALETLASLPVTGRRIAVLGRMGELGAASDEGHMRVGASAAQHGIDCVIVVGNGARLIGETARHEGVAEVFYAESNEEAAGLLREKANPGDALLVKGSRSARMETIVRDFAREEEAPLAGRGA